MNGRFQVADVLMELSTNNNNIFKLLEPFLSFLSGPADMKIEINSSRTIHVPEGEHIFDEMMTWIKKGPDGGGYFSFCKTRERIFVSVDADAEWKNVKINYLENLFPEEELNTNMDYFYSQIAGTALANHLLFKKGLVLHASCILYNKTCIAFTAPSGTGKSTHARLWEENKPGSVILNDDTPAIRLVNGKPKIYGTPWSGSQFKFINASALLSAIVILERTRKENSIRRVDPPEAILRLMPRFMLPYFDRHLLDIAINTLDEIIAKVPIYLLKCKPDAEAVELVYECVK